jgi:tetratricopeptide (TPR) repeat protein
MSVMTWAAAIALTLLPVAVQTQTPPSTNAQTPPVPSTQPPPAPSTLNVAPQQPKGTGSADERLARLEERVNLALALKDERIAGLNERLESVYKLLQLASVLFAIGLGAIAIRDTIIRAREMQRQRSIDDIVRDTMSLHRSATQQQIEFGSLQLKEAQTGLQQQVAGLQKVNEVIDVVQRTLAFRFAQEEMVADAMREIIATREQREIERKAKHTSAKTILDNFRTLSRMDFASLTDEQHRRGLRLQSLANEIEASIPKGDFEFKTSLLYTCGVIAYYDNDVIEAKSYLDRAAQSQADDHEAQLTKESYRKRFAFIHYFRALIEKNWGDLAEARHEIEQSARHLAERVSEFLTPVTRAEILSYIEGDEERCHADLVELLKRMEDLASAVKLDANQMKLRNRALILLGNTDFVRGRYAEALAEYERAIAFNQADYYALSSAAQCEEKLSGLPAAESRYRECLDAIERSDDFRRKRERITRAVIAVTAANAAQRCGDGVHAEVWKRESRALLGGYLKVDGLSPRFFSLLTKRLVEADELLKQLDTTAN